MTAKERVQNGAQWLDETEPGWEDRIDTARLHLANGTKCILGQLFNTEGGYYGVIRNENYPEITHRTAPDLGFTRFEDETGEIEGLTFADLDEAWRDLVAERRAAKLAQLVLSR